MRAGGSGRHSESDGGGAGSPARAAMASEQVATKGYAQRMMWPIAPPHHRVAIDPLTV